MSIRLNWPLSGPLRERPVSRVRELGVLECLPKWVICIPIVLQWLWLSLLYRSITLPSAANPRITSGGLVGDGKLEYFTGMGQIARQATAVFLSMTNHSTFSETQLQQNMDRVGLSFPLIAKPDIGLCGYGVQLLHNLVSLRTYLAGFPQNERVILQQYLPQEGEAGIFYARDPSSSQGRIIGLALRHYPQVTGDGRQNVNALVAAHPRARRLQRSRMQSDRSSGLQIPANGEVVRLSTIASMRVGGLYQNGGKHITSELIQAIDAIAKDMPSFYFGRFDVRFDNLNELCSGRGFLIMEINGASSEAIQAWDPSVGLISGLRMIFAKQRILFAIGDANRRNGIQAIGLLALMRLYLRQRRLIGLYPPSN